MYCACLPSPSAPARGCQRHAGERRVLRKAHPQSDIAVQTVRVTKEPPQQPPAEQPQQPTQPFPPQPPTALQPPPYVPPPPPRYGPPPAPPGGAYPAYQGGPA